MRLRLIACAAALAAFHDAGAQPHSADSFCWRGRPQSRCASFLLFEFSAPRHVVGTKLDPSTARDGNGHPRWDQGLTSQFVWDVGAMRNISERVAVGGTIEAGVIADDPRTVGLFGATGRYRRWLTPHVSADAALGVLRMPVGVETRDSFTGWYSRSSVRRAALTADLRLGYADLVGVTARAMLANDGRGRTHRALFAGVSVGSTATAAITGAYVALLGFFALLPEQEDVTVSGGR